MNEIDPIYKELAAILRAEDSKYMPRILEKLASVEQAMVVRELPASSEEIAKKLNLDKERVDKDLQELLDKGLIVLTRHGPRMSRSPIQLHDATTINRKYDESLGDEFFDLWEKYQLEEWFPVWAEEMVGEGFPYGRLIPRWKSIKDVPGVLPCEDAREILKMQKTIALVPCACKRVFRNRTCGVPEDTCLNVGRTAEYNLNRGIGRELTIKEALDFINEMDKYPVVHITSPNQKTVNVLLCNCHWCCCELLLPMMRQSKYKVYEGIAKSRFEATVDPEECIGCKTCVNIDVCQFGAAQMKYYPEFGEERAYIDTEKCMGCGSCVINCPAGARAMKLVRPPEHIPDVALSPAY